MLNLLQRIFNRRSLVACGLITIGVSGLTYYYTPHLIFKGYLNFCEFRARAVKKQIESDGFVQSYYDCGNGVLKLKPSSKTEPKEIVVVVHGFSNNKFAKLQFARCISDKYRVIIPDLPGHGETMPKDISISYTIPNQLDRLHNFVQAVLKESDHNQSDSSLNIKKSKIHLIGQSMGGCIVGLYAIKQPEEVKTTSLICCGGISSSKPSQFWRDINSGKRNQLLTSNVKEFDEMLSKLYFNAPYIPNRVKLWMSDSRSQYYALYSKIFDDVQEDLHNILQKNLQNLKVPTFIAYGDSDLVIDPSSIDTLTKEICSDTKVEKILFDRCGHACMSEASEALAQKYLTFLENFRKND